MGHNFHVQWNLKFEVESGEKAWSMPVITIHRCRENLQLTWQAVYAKPIE
jgi:hypothetical protein